jgi:hypothetical protein
VSYEDDQDAIMDSAREIAHLNDRLVAAEERITILDAENEKLLRDKAELAETPKHMLYTHKQMVALCDEAREQGRRGEE